MYASSLLESWLEDNCTWMHKARQGAVCKLVDGLLRGGVATLTAMGRHIPMQQAEKHGIKCADRLLGNRHLSAERLKIYQALGRWLLADIAQPWVVVDWSDVRPGQRFLMLKAAVPIGGRAVTVYEEVHPLDCYGSPATHLAFLGRLKSVVPSSCRPILITDAGFRGPWFKAVSALGWDWIGRVRDRVTYRHELNGPCRPVKSLYAQAATVPRTVGSVWLAKTNSYRCQLHHYHATPARRRGKQRSKPNGARKRRLGREPWVLATSLPLSDWSAQRVTHAYRQRMQIEETFRDLKSPRWGYGLTYSGSNSVMRLSNLLLLTTLATLVTCVTGLAARAANLARKFQANTEKQRHVLSVFSLGRRLLSRAWKLLSLSDIRNAWRELPSMAAAQALTA
jgi:hypothetical protein